MGEPEARVALLAGASGWVGAHALDALLAAPDFARVFAITRRPLEREHPRLANRIVQFERLEAQLKGSACDVAFCALGTTLRAAGSPQALRQVDLDYTLAFARAARMAGARRFVLVSSAGADARSQKLYLRIKGEAEEAVAGLAFPSLDILQPGVLLGWRSEWRPLELAARMLTPVVNPFLVGSRAAFRGIGARTVAAAMLGAARSGRKGVYRYTYEGIRKLAEKGDRPLF